MDTMEFRIQRLAADVQLPFQKHPGDAGWDLFSRETVVLAPGQRHVFALGFAAEFPASLVALIHDRSSLGSKGIHCLAGVIDASYRGEWKVVVLNTSPESYTISAGDRLAQCVFQRVEPLSIHAVDSLTTSSRGEGGFGSTGK
ncbi:MAG: dUTP diphosphatase [Candidatus Kerfeldbacteria bacterium]|nr:dUTP diphosphatase [Candidatus Kerfeldbacteria bacterium]